MANEFLTIYGEINSGAHQKPADLVGAPALVWHQAFWNSKHKEEDRDARADMLREFLHDLHAHILRRSDSDIPPLKEDIEILHDDRVRAITLPFKWHGMRAKIRVENHTEYITITCVVDASLDFFGPSSNVQAALEVKYPQYKNVRDHLRSFIDHAARRRNPSVICPIRLEDTWSYLYFTLWSHFFSEILDFDGYFKTVDENIKTQDRVPIGLKFADFRSLVTCDLYPGSDEAKRSESEGERRRYNTIDDELETQPIQGPFYKPAKDEERRGEWHRVGFPTRFWARRRLDDVWPFLEFAAGNDPLPLAGRTEFTVSGLLGGRVLYATALAPQPKMGVTGDERPLLFYMHSVTQDERQIGRLIDRLCHLGTLRLAAIVALPALKRVSQTLWNVEEAARETRRRVHDLIKVSSRLNRDDEERIDLEDRILSGLDSIHNAMADLSQGKLKYKDTELDPNLEVGDASIEYRLVRSQYYQRQFFDQIDALRIRRLEGYQPYNEFVRRRLQSAFGYIAGVGTRIDQIKAEWRALDQLYLTTVVTGLTGDIKNQQDSIHEVQDHVAVIDRWGLALLVGFLLPYYVVGLVQYLLTCHNTTRWCANTAPIFGLTWDTVLSGSIWLAFSVLAASLLFWRTGRERRASTHIGAVSSGRLHSDTLPTPSADAAADVS